MPDAEHGADAKHFLAWADEEGAEVALSAVLAELRVSAGQNPAPQCLAELLSAAEVLLARVTEELREGRAWAARRRSARDLITEADAEVRRAMDAEAAIPASKQKHNRAEEAAMITRAGKDIVGRLWHPSQIVAPAIATPVITTAADLASAAVELRSIAALEAARATMRATLGDEEPGAALVAADDTLRGIRTGLRRDEELIGLAACFLESLRRGGCGVKKSAKYVATMLDRRAFKPPNSPPLLASGGVVQRWRDGLPEDGSEYRKQVWRAFIGWADNGKPLPSWLARRLRQIHQAMPSEANRARLAALHCAPAKDDVKSWRKVAIEMRHVLARRFSR